MTRTVSKNVKRFLLVGRVVRKKLTRATQQKLEAVKESRQRSIFTAAAIFVGPIFVLRVIITPLLCSLDKYILGVRQKLFVDKHILQFGQIIFGDQHNEALEGRCKIDNIQNMLQFAQFTEV